MILILVVTVVAMVGMLYFVTSETAWDAFKHLGRKGNDVWDRFDNHINTKQPVWYTVPLRIARVPHLTRPLKSNWRHPVHLVRLHPVVTYNPAHDLEPKPRSEINR